MRCLLLWLPPLRPPAIVLFRRLAEISSPLLIPSRSLWCCGFIPFQFLYYHLSGIQGGRDNNWAQMICTYNWKSIPFYSPSFQSGSFFDFLWAKLGLPCPGSWVPPALWVSHPPHPPPHFRLESAYFSETTTGWALNFSWDWKWLRKFWGEVTLGFPTLKITITTRACRRQGDSRTRCLVAVHALIRHLECYKGDFINIMKRQALIHSRGWIQSPGAWDAWCVCVGGGASAQWHLPPPRPPPCPCFQVLLLPQHRYCSSKSNPWQGSVFQLLLHSTNPHYTSGCGWHHAFHFPNPHYLDYKNPRW